MAAMSSSPARSAGRVRATLAAAAVGAVVACAAGVAAGQFDDRGDLSSAPAGTESTKRPKIETDFDRSTPGSCLVWDGLDAGLARAVPCAEPHTFEVAADVDAATLDPAVFGPDAPYPSIEALSGAAAAACPKAVERYIGAPLDPNGRFSVQLMVSGELRWTEHDERTLRCGVQTTASTGEPARVEGSIKGQDQALRWPAGTCVGIDPKTKQATDPVDCSAPHAFEVVGDVDLGKKFGAYGSRKPWPGVKPQNDYLAEQCVAVTDKYLGKGGLDKSPLNLQWVPVAKESWAAPSRRAVCYLALPDGNGFATIVGAAKSTGLLVNGRRPAPPKTDDTRPSPTPVPLPPGYTPGAPQPAPGAGETEEHDHPHFVDPAPA